MIMPKYGNLPPSRRPGGKKGPPLESGMSRFGVSGKKGADPAHAVLGAGKQTLPQYGIWKRTDAGYKWTPLPAHETHSDYWNSYANKGGVTPAGEVNNLDEADLVAKNKELEKKAKELEGTRTGAPAGAPVVRWCPCGRVPSKSARQCCH